MSLHVPLDDNCLRIKGRIGQAVFKFVVVVLVSNILLLLENESLC